MFKIGLRAISTIVGYGLARGGRLLLILMILGTQIETSLALDAPANSTQESRIEFNIPPQALGSALNAFAVATGWQISASSEDTAGQESSGVIGTYMPEEGLRALLADTGLTYRIDGDQMITIERSNESTAIQAKGLSNDEPPLTQPAQNKNPIRIRLEPIVVEGERVQRNVIDTNSSLHIQTGENLQRERQIHDFKALVNVLPNVFDEVGTNNAPTIRGVDSTGPSTGSGAYFGGARPRASLVVDGRALSSLELSFAENSIWDLEQIEAFNGPQTTTNGPNSLGGAIFMTTRNPSYEWEFAGRAYGGIRNNYAGSVLANFPIVPGQFAIRAAVDWEKQDSWRKALAAARLEELDVNERFNGRIKALYEPEAIEGLSTLVTFNYNEDSGPQTLLSDPPYKKRDSTNRGEAAFTNEIFSAIHDVSYEFGEGFTFNNRFQIAQSETARVPPSAPAIGTIALEGDEIGNEAWINFALIDGRLTGVFGGNWLKREEDVETQVFRGATFGGLNESYGLFGEATYDVTDRWHVTLGGRVQRDKSARTGDPIPPFGLVDPLDFAKWYSAFMPKASISYDVTPDIRVGALVSKGYNPGGITRVLGVGFVEYDKESLWNYELFTRATLFNDRLRLSANVFYNQMNDYQVSTLVLFGAMPVTRIDNADEVETYGLDFSAEGQVTDHLRVDLSLGLLHTEIKEFSVSLDPVIGKELPRAPEVTFSLGTQYDVTEALSVGGRARYVGSFFGDTVNSATTKAGDYFVVDLNASWQLFENVGIFGFVNNLFDTDYIIQQFAFGDSRRVGFGDPFEFGIGTEFLF